MLRDLQSRADIIGPSDPFWRENPIDGKNKPAHRVRRQPAVSPQLFERVVAVDQLVLAIRLDEIEKRLLVQPARGNGFPHLRQNGMCSGSGEGRRSAESGLKVPLPLIERLQSFTVRLVAEVVGHAGEAINGHHMTARALGKETGGYREVLAARFGPDGSDFKTRWQSPDPFSYSPSPSPESVMRCNATSWGCCGNFLQRREQRGF